MALDRLLQNAKFINALPPVADMYESGPNSTDIINMQDWKHAMFIIQEGIGTTGTAVVTVESCDDVTPTTATAVAFRYKILTSGDTEGDTTAATTAGFTTTAGSNHLYMIEIDDDMLSTTDQYVRMKLTEADDAVVIGGVTCILTGGRQMGDDLRTAIV